VVISALTNILTFFGSPFQDISILLGSSCAILTSVGIFGAGKPHKTFEIFRH